VLFCIDQDYKDKHVEESLAGLGQVYYINRLDDLVSVVVGSLWESLCRGKFYLLSVDSNPGVPG
jgi:hypothetical protein